MTEKKNKEEIKAEKKPAIIVRVKGFGNMNSGPMSAENDDLTEITTPCSEG